MLRCNIKSDVFSHPIFHWLIVIVSTINTWRIQVPLATIQQKFVFRQGPENFLVVEKMKYQTNALKKSTILRHSEVFVSLENRKKEN